MRSLALLPFLLLVACGGALAPEPPEPEVQATKHPQPTPNPKPQPPPDPPVGISECEPGAYLGSDAACPCGWFCGYDGRRECANDGCDLPLPPPPPDAGASSFTCGDTTCDPSGAYCVHVTSARGNFESFTCKTFAETGCANSHNCACIRGTGLIGLADCTETNGVISIEENYP